jgi:cytochrome c-type biogenesis protein CcsB
MFRVLKFLASPMLMAILIIAFGVSCAIATFVENDFGTSAARALIYNAWWFELIMLFLAINFISSVFTRKLYMKEKIPILLFHVGFVIILLGAGITRYFGQEGMMHIREGETSTSFTSTEKCLIVKANDEIVSQREVNFTPVSRNRYNKSLVIYGKKYKIELADFIPHAVETVVEHYDGYPIVSFQVIDDKGNHPILIRPEHGWKTKQVSIGIVGNGVHDIELNLTDSGVVARAHYPLLKRSMLAEEEIEIPINTWFKMDRQVFYEIKEIQFAYRNHWPKARIKMAYSGNPSIPGHDVLVFNVRYDSESREVFVPLSEVEDDPIILKTDQINLSFKYSPVRMEIPFGIKLNKFLLERYPGSQSPSSFISDVIVVNDDMGDYFPYSVYMNNILNYKGYRFYQSSYDPDEMGTYLSVNKDFWGTSITYFGYFILIVGILWSLFAPGTRFRKLITKSSAGVVLLFGLLVSSSVFSQTHIAPDASHASHFGQIVLQDKGGRIKPISTLSGEVLRKLNRSNKFLGQSPEQVFLSMSAFPDQWQHIPVIKIKSKELRAVIGIRSEMATFVDFFDHQAGSSYKLGRLVQEAFALKPDQRTRIHKDAIKADEKVNILYMIFSGQMASIFPLPNYPEKSWLNMAEAMEDIDSTGVKVMANQFADYLQEIRRATQHRDWTEANITLGKLLDYQQKHGKEIMPSTGKIKVEVFTNKLLIFERLIPFYGFTGLILLILVFLELFRRSKLGNRLYLILFSVLLIGFVFHTTAIGMRWYIAGRAPLSNAYETMIYIAWAAMLTGFIFSKRSRVVVPATALLSTLTLFVAHLSWMDPEITNLVPVLKSYWLTIHVAVITASYGFFGLSAILGLFNLGLFSFKSKSNSEMIDKQIVSITNINELNLTLGLYLLTIGSFLGAVWANESWGRYWGWDPKETWALITILVYAFILHMRLIPSFKTLFSFNFASIIALGSVLMTYFGVNYYLSGLHSYAGGDSVPIPSWLYFIIAAILSLAFFAWYNNRLVDKEMGDKNGNLK